MGNIWQSAVLSQLRSNSTWRQNPDQSRIKIKVINLLEYGTPWKKLALATLIDIGVLSLPIINYWLRSIIGIFLYEKFTEIFMYDRVQNDCWSQISTFPYHILLVLNFFQSKPSVLVFTRLCFDHHSRTCLGNPFSSLTIPQESFHVFVVVIFPSIHICCFIKSLLLKDLIFIFQVSLDH